VKFVVISDTHGQHNAFSLPEGDVIIHAGDVSNIGKPIEIIQFLNWFESLNYQHKIFIAGNHDFFFENASASDIEAIIPPSVYYLNDSCKVIDNIKIWGSPITPWFHNWAFNRQRGKEIDLHWDKIPSDTDILVTHGPADTILDKTTRGIHTGCTGLLEKIRDIKPKYHICGHIHEAFGVYETSDTTFINASLLDENYRVKNKPVIFEI
jgi:Icc-related predicted phosphoesterase